MSHTCTYFPAAEIHSSLANTHFSSRWGQEAELAGWGLRFSTITALYKSTYLLTYLHTETVYARNETVTHLSTNRARRRVTSLIRPTTLWLRHAAIFRLQRYRSHLTALYCNTLICGEQSALRTDIPSLRNQLVNPETAVWFKLTVTETDSFH